MASVDYGVIPRSTIKTYAVEDLGLVGDEVDLFIAVMRRVENKSRAKVSTDPNMTDQVSAGDSDGVKQIVSRLAKNRPERPTIKPRVRHPRP